MKQYQTNSKFLVGLSGTPLHRKTKVKNNVTVLQLIVSNSLKIHTFKTCILFNRSNKKISTCDVNQNFCLKHNIKQSEWSFNGDFPS